MNHNLKRFWWTPAIAAVVAIPLYNLVAEHKADQKHDMHGTLVSLEQHLAGNDGRLAVSAFNSGGPWAIKTDDGLVILSGDAARMWRGERQQSQLNLRGDQQDNAAFGIEKRETPQQAQAVRDSTKSDDASIKLESNASDDQKGSLSLRSSDPNANFRIVTGSDAHAQQTDAGADYGALAIERQDRSVGAARAGRFPAEAFGGHVIVTGTMYERDGIKFMKVESIRSHVHDASETDADDADSADSDNGAPEPDDKP